MKKILLTTLVAAFMATSLIACGSTTDTTNEALTDEAIVETAEDATIDEATHEVVVDEATEDTEVSEGEYKYSLAEGLHFPDHLGFTNKFHRIDDETMSDNITVVTTIDEDDNIIWDDFRYAIYFEGDVSIGSSAMIKEEDDMLILTNSEGNMGILYQPDAEEVEPELVDDGEAEGANVKLISNGKVTFMYPRDLGDDIAWERYNSIKVFTMDEFDSFNELNQSLRDASEVILQ